MTLSTRYIVGGGCTPQGNLIITGHAFDPAFLEACEITSPMEIVAHVAGAPKLRKSDRIAGYVHRRSPCAANNPAGPTPWLTPAQADALHALGRKLK